MLKEEAVREAEGTLRICRLAAAAVGQEEGLLQTYCQEEVAVAAVVAVVAAEEQPHFRILQEGQVKVENVKD